MLNVLQIPLADILERYKGYSAGDFSDANDKRTMTICPFHGDTNPSMALYDNDARGQYYKCFVCGAHGNGIQMVVGLGAAENSSKAEALLRKDFGMEFPLQVTLDVFCEWKGIPKDLVTGMGWEDCSVGFSIPYYDTEERLIGRKVRVKYDGKDKYFWDRAVSETNDFHYGWHLLHEYSDDRVVFIEGETDTATLRLADAPAIGINGNLGFLGHKYGHLYDRFRKKVVLRDNDRAGKLLLDMVAAHYPNDTYELVIQNSQKDINDLFNFSLGRDVAKLKEVLAQGKLFPATIGTVDAWLDTQSPNELFADERSLARVLRLAKSAFEVTLLIEKLVVWSGKTKTLVKELVSAATGSGKADGAITEGLQAYDGCYWKTKTAKGVSYEVAISNFTIKPQHVVDVEGVANRVLTLTNTDGVTTRDVVFSPDDFANTQKFNVRCMAAGPYHFTGDGEDLHSLMTHLINSKVPTVYAVAKSGRITPEHWVFRNLGINRSGQIVPVDNGRVTLDGKTYIPSRPGDDTGAVTAMLRTRPDLSYDEAAWQALPHALLKSYGTPDVLLALGAVTASAASDHIFQRAGSFPLVFFAGKRASGKTTLAEILFSLFGGEGAHSYHSTTQAAISRIMGQYHSLPILFDDFRAVAANAHKNDVMLNVYNRQGKLRADSNFGSGIKADPIVCTMMLSGEDLPTDNALATRCINVSVTANKGDRSPDTLANLFGVAGEAAHYVPHLIARLHADPSGLLAEVDRWVNKLMSACPEPRQRQNLSVALGGLTHCFTINATTESMLYSYVTGKAEGDRRDNDGDHTLAQFLNTIAGLVAAKELEDGLHYAIKEDGVVALRMSDIIPIIESKTRRVYQEATLRLYLREETFFLGCDKVRGFGNKRMRATLLDPSKMDDTLHDFKEVMKGSEY